MMTIITGCIILNAVESCVFHQMCIVCILGYDEDELPCMDDEEIDRIFGDATSGYDTPSIVTVKENVADIVDWEYKLPDPPSAFRDVCGGDRSPTVTMFDTVTVGSNLKDVVVILQDDEPAAVVGPEDDKDGRAAVVASGGGSVKKMIGYHDNCCFTQDSGIGSDDSSLPSSCEEKLHADDKPAVVHHAVAAVSKLNNFKIAAYDEDRTGPTEIFCDDSVKTWKTTQMARESNPAYRSQTPSSASAIRHHKSFSADRANLSVPVKRSTSHISLLSGNITPSNRLAKHYVGRRTFSSERLNLGSLVRRSFSVDDITEGSFVASYAFVRVQNNTTLLFTTDFCVRRCARKLRPSGDDRNDCEKN